MAVDPILTDARDALVESLDEIRSTIAGLTPQQLNARPAGRDTNPMSVIVTHALESTRAWLSIATGNEPPARNRPAEFRAVADDGFPDWVETRIGECVALLDRAKRFDPTYRALAPWRVDAPEEPVSAGWALFHALAHLGEHVGHAHVIRDLLRAGVSA